MKRITLFIFAMLALFITGCSIDLTSVNEDEQLLLSGATFNTDYYIWAMTTENTASGDADAFYYTGSAYTEDTAWDSISQNMRFIRCLSFNNVSVCAGNDNWRFTWACVMDDTTCVETADQSYSTNGGTNNAYTIGLGRVWQNDSMYFLSAASRGSSSTGFRLFKVYENGTYWETEDVDHGGDAGSYQQPYIASPRNDKTDLGEWYLFAKSGSNNDSDSVLLGYNGTDYHINLTFDNLGGDAAPDIACADIGDICVVLFQNETVSSRDNILIRFNRTDGTYDVTSISNFGDGSSDTTQVRSEMMVKQIPGTSKFIGFLVANAGNAYGKVFEFNSTFGQGVNSGSPDRGEVKHDTNNGLTTFWHMWPNYEENSSCLVYTDNTNDRIQTICYDAEDGWSDSDIDSAETFDVNMGNIESLLADHNYNGTNVTIAFKNSSSRATGGIFWTGSTFEADNAAEIGSTYSTDHRSNVHPIFVDIGVVLGSSSGGAPVANCYEDNVGKGYSYLRYQNGTAEWLGGDECQFDPTSI